MERKDLSEIAGRWERVKPRSWPLAESHFIPHRSSRLSTGIQTQSFWSAGDYICPPALACAQYISPCRNLISWHA